MMKIQKLTILLILLTTFIAAPLFAEDKIVDNANLLNAGEKAVLKDKIDELTRTYNFDLVIVTEETILGGKTPAQFAALYYQINGYNTDGCMLVQVSQTRDYEFYTSGRASQILNEAAYNKLDSDVLDYLSEGRTYEAYWAFLSDWEEFLELDANGRSYNFFHQYNGVLVVIIWIIALLIGFIVVAVWKKGMNTALEQTQAQGYVVAGSLKYNDKKDTLTNSKTTKTRRQSSSGGGGSSGVRKSSGRGGKY